MPILQGSEGLGMIAGTHPPGFKQLENVWERHRQIMELYTKGLPKSVVARRVGLDFSTVHYHIEGRCQCLDLK